MTEEQKRALIKRIEQLQEEQSSHWTGNYPGNELDQEIWKIALAALTAQPVRLLDCDFGAVSHMSGVSKDYCNGFVDGTQNAIKAIRAAGYQVEGE